MKQGFNCVEFLLLGSFWPNRNRVLPYWQRRMRGITRQKRWAINNHQTRQCLYECHLLQIEITLATTQCVMINDAHRAKNGGKFIDSCLRPY